MSLHEGYPWKEPQRSSRAHGRVVFGCLLALACLIVLAVMEIGAAAVIAGLAVFTVLVLAIGSTVSKHRHP